MNNVNFLNSPKTHMDFNEFSLYRKQFLTHFKNHEHIFLDLAENNLFKVFPSSVNSNEISTLEEKSYPFHLNGNVHRCHLIEDWLNLYHISLDYKNNIGYSKGVRNSFSTIAQAKIFKNKKWLIPSDVYPFYSNFVNAEGYSYQEYETMNSLYAPLYLREDCEDNLQFKSSEVIIITFPLKPLGKEANQTGKSNLRRLILNNPNKTFIFDAVYFNQYQDGLEFVDYKYTHPDMQYMLELYSFGNVFLLFSTSKNWSIPQMMGLTFIPSKFQHIKTYFQNLNIEKTQLKMAYSALNFHSDMPFKMAKMQLEQRLKLNNIWKIKYGIDFFADSNIHHLPEMKAQAGYLYHINKSVEDLYKDGILSIPASAFGGKFGSIISTLF